MCKASLEGFKTRDAKEGDTVYAVENHSGAFHNEPGHQLTYHYGEVLVCVRYGQKLTIEDLQLSPAAMRHDIWRHGIFDKLKRGVGKRHVVELWRSNSEDKNGDMIMFKNRLIIPSAALSSHCPLYVGVKPTLEKKLGLDTFSQVKGDMYIGDVDKEPIDTVGEAQVQRWPFRHTNGDD